MKTDHDWQTPPWGRPQPVDGAPLKSRLPAFVAGPPEAAALLARLNVMLVGLGSVGLNLAQHLARLGVRSLWLVDPKRLKPESILTHPIAAGDIGQQKTTVAARQCRAIHPTLDVRMWPAPIATLSLADVERADAVCLATDHPQPEVETGQLCLHAGKPLLQASVHGETLCAQVRCFGTVHPDGACPACGFNEEEWRALNSSVRFNCDGTPASGQPVEASPTNSTSFLCALAANLALTQLLRRVLRLGAAVDNTVLDYCGYTNQLRAAPLARNPDCPCDHILFRPARFSHPLDSASPRQLAQAAGFGERPFSISIEHQRWVEQASCGCGPSTAVDRFLPAAKTPTLCPACHQPFRFAPFYAHPAVSSHRLLGKLDLPLHQLGATRPASVLLRRDGEAVLFRQAGATAETQGAHK